MATIGIVKKVIFIGPIIRKATIEPTKNVTENLNKDLDMLFA